MSLRQTAQQVHLHHTTVQYRLKRIEQVLGVDLQDPAARAADADRDPPVPDRARRRGHRRLSGIGRAAANPTKDRWSHVTGPGLRPTCTFPPAAARPAVLARTPYGARAATRSGSRRSGRLFADHGLAFVAQDTRGHHGSGGAAVPFDEAMDGWDTLDWMTDQPWSDGVHGGVRRVLRRVHGHRDGRQRPSGGPRGGLAQHGHGHRRRLAPPSGRPPPRVRPAMGSGGLVRTGEPGPRTSTSRAVPLDRIARASPPRLVPDGSPAVLDALGEERPPGRRVRPSGSPWPTLIDRLHVPVHFTTGWWDLFVRGAVRDWSRLSARRGAESRLSPTRPITPAVTGATDRRPTRSPTSRASPTGCRTSSAASSPSSASTCSTVSTAEPPPVLDAHARGDAGVPFLAATGRRGVDPVPRGRGHAARGPEGGGLSTRPDRIPLDARWRHDPRTSSPPSRARRSTGGSAARTSGRRRSARTS